MESGDVSGGMGGSRVMTDALNGLWKSGMIAIASGMIAGAATIAVNDFKVSELSSRVQLQKDIAERQYERIDARVRTLEIQTAADIREIKTILQRMERD